MSLFLGSRWLASFSILFLAGLASAVTVPLTRREIPHSTSVRLTNGSSNPSDPFNFQNLAGFRYLSTIFINGMPAQVELDTGSSVLWIDTKRANLSLEGGTPTGIPAGIIYEDKTGAEGTIELIDITWGDFTVKNQAFINAPGANGTKGILDGFLGLGPPALSELPAAVQKANAKLNSNMLIVNIFDFYPDEPNFITFLLSRNVAGIIDGGDFTIGEIVKGYEAIASAPKLPIISKTRWLTLIDGLIINGRRFTGNSHTVSGVDVPDGTVSAIFDTGISFNIAPKAFVDAMFQNVPGAVFDEKSRNYVVPCDTKVNVSLAVNGLEYPIHPADLIAPSSVVNGSVVCVGAFTASDEGTTIGDMQFGDVVMRNLYTLYDFGSFSRPGSNPPFIQILQLTDAAKAWVQFDSIQPARVQEFLAYNNKLFANELSSTIVNVVTAQVSKPTSTPVAFSPNNASESKNFAAGALVSPDSYSEADVKNLIKNTYIIIGLVGTTLLMMVVMTMVTLVRGMGPQKKHKYQPIIPPIGKHHSYQSHSGKYAGY